MSCPCAVSEFIDNDQSRTHTLTVYVLVAVLRKRLGVSADLYTILQVLSLTLFEKMPIFKLFSDIDYNLSNLENPNQLILFE